MRGAMRRSRQSTTSRRRSRCRPSLSSRSTTTRTSTRKALCCSVPCASATARAHGSCAWTCTITYRWSTSSTPLTMRWVAKSWSSSSAAGDHAHSRRCSLMVLEGHPGVRGARPALVHSWNLSATACFSETRERGHRRREAWATQQGFACLPLSARVQSLQNRHLFAGQQRDRDAVAVEQSIAGERSEPRPGREDADEIERVGGGEREPLARVLLASHLAQHADGIRQRELLTCEAGHESATTDFSARLEPAID